MNNSLTFNTFTMFCSHQLHLVRKHLNHPQRCHIPGKQLLLQQLRPWRGGQCEPGSSVPDLCAPSAIPGIHPEHVLPLASQWFECCYERVWSIPPIIGILLSWKQVASSFTKCCHKPIGLCKKQKAHSLAGCSGIITAMGRLRQENHWGFQASLATQ